MRRLRDVVPAAAGVLVEVLVEAPSWLAARAGEVRYRADVRAQTRANRGARPFERRGLWLVDGHGRPEDPTAIVVVEEEA